MHVHHVRRYTSAGDFWSGSFLDHNDGYYHVITIIIMDEVVEQTCRDATRSEQKTKKLFQVHDFWRHVWKKRVRPPVSGPIFRVVSM
jgi:hypothetical protein